MRYVTGLMICLLLAMGALGLSSCDITNPEQNAKAEILELLEDIEHYFNYKEIAPILAMLDPEYQHNGMGTWQFRNLWEGRMATWLLLEISEVSVEIDGDYATASMRLKFINPEGEYLLYEPQSSGDISYFFYDGYRWKICGNEYYQYK